WLGVVAAEGRHRILRCLQPERRGEEGGQPSRLQVARRADAFAIRRAYVLLAGREPRTVDAVAELHHGAAVVVDACRVDALRRPATVEERSRVPAEIVH